MKVAIIGAGNMGGAIARGLAQGENPEISEILVTNPSPDKLYRLRQEFPVLQVSQHNRDAADADLVIVAVKPGKVEEVLRALRLRQPQILVSVAAGPTFEELAHFVDPEMPMFRVVPNTAIAERASMTLISSRNATAAQVEQLLRLFDQMGRSMLVEEHLLPVATSLASCGIAYVMKYVQAAMQAGVEAGLRPQDARQMVVQTLEGASRLLNSGDHTHPALEIERVATPGGLTIRGLNSLEYDGFAAAVIRAFKQSM